MKVWFWKFKKWLILYKKQQQQSLKKLRKTAIFITKSKNINRKKLHSFYFKFVFCIDN